MSRAFNVTDGEFRHGSTNYIQILPAHTITTGENPRLNYEYNRGKRWQQCHLFYYLSNEAFIDKVGVTTAINSFKKKNKNKWCLRVITYIRRS